MIKVSTSLIDEPVYFEANKKVQISVVAYEHANGIPARFLVGLIPAIELYRLAKSHGLDAVIRIIDPTHIASYCNGWSKIESKFTEIISEFLNLQNVSFFFDQAEELNNSSLEILKNIGSDLEQSTDSEIIAMVQRIKESGRKHGGDDGAENTLIYMAAHPFSWLDMYHPLIWKKEFSSEDIQFVNLMSKPEARFSLIRDFLKKSHSHLVTNHPQQNRYMTVCNTPCYIPLTNEPLYSELSSFGYEWSHRKYFGIKGQSNNHRRALKDFELLMSFLGLKVD